MPRNLHSITLSNGIIVTIELSEKQNVRLETEVIKAVIISNDDKGYHTNEIMDAFDEAIDRFKTDQGLSIYVPLERISKTTKNNIVRHFIS